MFLLFAIEEHIANDWSVLRTAWNLLISRTLVAWDRENISLVNAHDIDELIDLSFQGVYYSQCWLY